MLEIAAGGFAFTARLEDDTAPETVAAFRRLLPLDSKIIHVRWSGEGGWIPMGDLDVGIGPENATSYPSPGELIFYPGGVSETELLLAYGYVAFASKAGALAGNHFATIVCGRENLRELGRRMLWDGAQDISFSERKGEACLALGETRERITEHVDGERDVLLRGELVRRVAHAAVQAPDEEHPLDARRREDARVVSRARCELERPVGQAPRSRRGAPCGRPWPPAPCGTPAPADRGDEGVEPPGPVRGRRPRSRARRDHVRCSGLDVDLARRSRRRPRCPRGIADRQQRLGRGHERVLAPGHRRRAGVSGAPSNTSSPRT